jgi:hypothetical protein
MKTRWAMAMAMGGIVPVLSFGCGDEDGETISGSTGGVSNSGVGGSFVAVGAPDGARTVEGMADCPPCEEEQGCVSIAVDLADDDSTQPWVAWPEEADGVGTLRVAVTISGEVWQQAQEEADLLAGTVNVALCAGTGNGTLSVFLDDNDNAGEAATTSGDYLDSCGRDRALQVQVTAGKTFAVPFELAGSCD